MYCFNRKGWDYLGERKRDFNRIFKTIRRMKGGDNEEKRAKNGILFFFFFFSRENSLDRCVRFRSGSRIFPVLLNPRARRCAFTKVEEPVGTIRRKRPKDRDARKESNRGEGKKRERRGRKERRGEERREEKERREVWWVTRPERRATSLSVTIVWMSSRSNLVDT